MIHRCLLDTCVLSEIRRPGGNPNVANAVDALADHEVFVSVVSLGEIRKCAWLLDEGRRRRELLEWLERLEQGLAIRTLTVDLETAKIWGELTANAQRKGRQVSAADGLIAATAIRHGLAVMTRNVRDFEATSVAIVDPWAPRNS